MCYSGVCVWTDRSAGQPCKLKADERSKGSLKETAAVPPPPTSSLPPPPTAELTWAGPTVNRACPSCVSVLFSPSPGWCCLPVRTSHNEAVSDFTHTPSTELCSNNTHTHTLTLWWEKLWMNEHFLFSSFTVTFQGPTGLWLCLLLRLTLSKRPMTHTHTHIYCLVQSKSIF